MDGFDGKDITVSGQQLYYTSPGSQSIRTVDLATGDVAVLVQNVTRTGRIYVHRTFTEETVHEVRKLFLKLYNNYSYSAGRFSANNTCSWDPHKIRHKLGDSSLMLSFLSYVQESSGARMKDSL